MFSDTAGGDKNFHVISSELFRKQCLCSSNIAVCFIEVAVVFDWGIIYRLLLEVIILMMV